MPKFVVQEHQAITVTVQDVITNLDKFIRLTNTIFKERQELPLLLAKG
jgi:hypothetical protein